MRLLAALVAVAGLALVPLVADAYWTSLILQMLIFGLLALSVDLLLGHAGLFSLCHAAFFAVAAYTAAILEVRYGVATVPAVAAALVMASLLAAVFGLAVRTRGVYFILTTIALGFIIWGMAHRWAGFTGGDNGIVNVPLPALGPWRIETSTGYYYLALAVILGCVAAYAVLVASPFGLALRGIKGSESRMRSLGYNPTALLYAAFVLSGILAGIAGILYVHYNRFVNPAAAAFPVSVEAALMVIIGGSGTLAGPFIGAGVILALRNWVSSFVEQYNAIMGIVFIATVLWAPSGIMGLVRRLRARPRQRAAVTLPRSAAP